MLLKFNQRAVGSCQHVSAIIAPLGIPFHAGHYYASEMSQLGRINDFFPPLASCIAPSNTMKASPQRGSFLVTPSSYPLSPTSKFFSNRDLLSASIRQPRSIAIAHIVFSVIWIPLTNNFKGGFSYLVLRFCQIIYVF